MNFKTVVRPLILVGLATASVAAVSVAAVSVTGAKAQPKVTKADLFAGNPNYNEPKERAKEGQGLLDNPPLGWRTLFFVGDKLVTTTGPEIWCTDMSAAKPVLKRLAGQEVRDNLESLKPGPAAQARFANLSGLALLPDGSLVSADTTGNTVFKVKDPFGPNATVEFLAGTIQAVDGVDPTHPPNAGDVDGPGNKARFSGPQWPAVIGNDIYVLDEIEQGKVKVKKVAGGAAHPVSTIAQLPEGVYYGMIALNGKLYAIGNNTKSEGFVEEIDPATKATRDVIRGRPDAFESDGAIKVSGLTTDGKGLFITSSGQLLYLTLDGKVTSLAGTGDWFDYRGGYDPTKTQKPNKVQLVTQPRTATAGSDVFLGFKNNTVYMSAKNLTPYIEKLSLQ